MFENDEIRNNEEGFPTEPEHTEITPEQSAIETEQPVTETVQPEMPRPVTETYTATAEPEKKEKKAGKEKKVKEKKPAGFGKRFLATACLGVLFGACAFGGFYGVNKAMDHFGLTASKQEATAEVTKDTPIGSTEYVTLPSTSSDEKLTQYVTYVQDDISGMVEQVMPAMVSIQNTYTTTSYVWGQKYSQSGNSSGSGIIVGETDEALLIATNNHVVEDADKLEVTFIDGTTASAIIKGTDEDMDLAVIAVPISNLTEDTKTAITVASLGDSTSLKLGEPVVAIGNALGYGQSVTNGIVSALDRELESDDGTTNYFIQTNAAINPGNSGGALLNIKGEVIGINSSKIGGGMVEGMGYAIPISSATPILNELMNRKTRIPVNESEYGYLGIVMQAIPEEISTNYNWPKGVFIKEVAEGSAAEQAGLLYGDIIVKMDGQKITNTDELTEIIHCFKVGDTVSVTIQRPVGGGFDSMDFEIVLGERPTNY